MRGKMTNFRFSVANVGIKQTKRPDIALIVAHPPARWAGFFTTNAVKAAPVVLGMERLKKGVPLAAILVNSGNANACVGERGMRDALALCREVASLLKVPEDQVLMASTGVIGQPLPVEKMKRALPRLVEESGNATLEDLAAAIMTTDRYPKWEETRLEAYPEITLAGVVKGAGMIRPDMATMLGFFFMNAGLSASDLEVLGRDAVRDSFNRITVDGDQSTNDTVLVLDNGDERRDAHDAEGLKHAVSPELKRMMRSLSEKIVDNGEGVSKVVTVLVEGARNEREAEQVARSVANSPLVKTAFYGQDPNWGRIMAAVGYSGVEVTPERVDIYLDKVCLVKGGCEAGGDAERRAADVMKRRAFTLRIDLGDGQGKSWLITSDLSVEYVKINADYRS